MEQLREVLKEVLHEELKEVLQKEWKVALGHELSPIRDRLDGLEVRGAAMSDQISGIQGQVSGMQGQISGMQGQLSDMQNQLNRMERAQTEDVVALLQTIDNKITERTDRHEHQINLLNHRLLIVEAEVKKLQTK